MTDIELRLEVLGLVFSNGGFLASGQLVKIAQDAYGWVTEGTKEVPATDEEQTSSGG